MPGPLAGGSLRITPSDPGITAGCLTTTLCAILKKPKIIMLDEATSALDGETEQKIQSKVISGKFGQDRTLLIIA